MPNDKPVSETTPIRAALDAAVAQSGTVDAAIGGDGTPYDRQVVGHAVAAFLRALPPDVVMEWDHSCAALAAMVEAEADAE